MKIKYEVREQPRFITTENIHLLKVGMKVKIISGCNVNKMNGIIEHVTKIDIADGSRLYPPRVHVGIQDVTEYAICYDHKLDNRILKLEILK